MADSKISWTTKVWNVTRGCRRISPGCGGANGEGGCYAERMAYRFSGAGQAYEGLVKMTANGPRWTGAGRFASEKLNEPLSWRKPVRVFVDSMSDLFFDAFTNEEIAAVFGVMAATPHITYQVLTKRAWRMRIWFEWVAESAARNGVTPAAFCFALSQARGIGNQSRDVVDRARAAAWPLPNAWIGVSTENQQTADERISCLLDTPAVIRFISAEPLLEGILLWAFLKSELRDRSLKALGETKDVPGLDWVICGCESGPRSRTCEVDWVRSIRDECEKAGVAFWLKQATPAPGSLAPDAPTPAPISIGKNASWKQGAVIELPYLDGVQHAAFPE